MKKAVWRNGYLVMDLDDVRYSHADEEVKWLFQLGLKLAHNLSENKKAVLEGVTAPKRRPFAAVRRLLYSPDTH